jgi:hypothetical protein
MDLANVIKAATVLLNNANTSGRKDSYNETEIDDLIKRLSDTDFTDDIITVLTPYLTELTAYNEDVLIPLPYNNKITYLINLINAKNNPSAYTIKCAIPSNYDDVPPLLDVSGNPLPAAPVTPGAPGDGTAGATGATGATDTTDTTGATVTPVTPGDGTAGATGDGTPVIPAGGPGTTGGPGATVTTVTPGDGTTGGPGATGNGANAKNAVQASSSVQASPAAQAQDLKVILRFEGDNTYKVIEVKDKTDTDHILERKDITQCFAYKSPSAEAASSAPTTGSTFSTTLKNTGKNIMEKFPSFPSFGKKPAAGPNGTNAGTGANAVTNEETMNPMQANTGGKRKTKKRRITKKRNQKKPFKSRSKK